MEYFCGNAVRVGTMNGMTLRLDPAVARVWRTPYSVQFGADEPLAVLDGVDAAHERLLEALTVGTGIAGLNAIASQYGLTDRQVDDTVRALERVLITTDEPPSAAAPRARRVTLTGTAPTAHTIGRLLDAEGVTVDRVADPTRLARTPTDLGIAVGHFVLSPELHSAWLRHDIPHLPVVWGDKYARIGPLIEPGHGPCLHCLERHRTDRDPAWPAIASQLLGRSSTLEAPVLTADVAILATRIALARLTGAPGRAIATRVDANGGRTTEESHPHPECGCHSLAELITLPTRRRRSRSTTTARARRETVTASARRAATTATTTRANAREPG